MSDTTNDNKPATEDLMGYEGQVELKASPVELPKNDAKDTQTLINDAVKEVTVDDNGKYVYPEGMDPMLKAAVAATKSYRDNQSGYTKSQQSLKEIEAENEALREQLAKSTQKSLELSTEDQIALDKLYTENPDAWRAKMNKLEQQSSIETREALETVTEEARQKAGAEYELNRRYAYLETFNQGRDTPITEEILNDDIPPRITNKLAKAEITFEQYLDEVSEYLKSGTTIATTTDTTTTDLNKANGSSESNPSEEFEGIDYSNQAF